MAPFTSSLIIPLLLLLVWDPTPASAKWQTLSGQAPVVIANGGTSGLYPDQTTAAYHDALQYSVPGVVITCDLQMSKSLQPQFLSTGTGICRTGLNLADSTTIRETGPQFNNTYIVDGTSTLGWFAIDIPYENLTLSAPARQSNNARTPAYDGAFTIQKPEYLNDTLASSPYPSSTWWLNSEYTTFIEQNSKFNPILYLQEAIAELYPGYVSVPEISLLQAIQANASKSGTKLIYKFQNTATMDMSTNQTYTALLQNLTYIRTLASGILVPKSYIWPIDPATNYLQPPTTLVEDAHKVKLEVYAYDFANDNDQVFTPPLDPTNPGSYNFSFDPVTEILYFIETYNFSVDGIFTDFPTTASEAISCYASNSRNSTLQNKEVIPQKQTVISHNGDSGKYPGATTPAYISAINAGVDYIDCIVQISKDGVPFCRFTVNLLDTTDAGNTPFFETYLTQYPGFYDDLRGVFAFDLTWAQISTLHANIYSPEANIPRDPNYNGQFGIIGLVEFLSLAKNNSVGALIDIQNAIYLRDEQNLTVVDVVAEVLSTSGYNSTDKVILQSDESAALARLVALNVTYPRMYRIKWTPDISTMPASPVSLTATDFVEIRQYASSVNLDARLVEPFDSNFFLRNPPTDLIKLAHDQNLTAYFQLQMNEFLAYAFDLKADPTLQLYSLVSYGIDGFVTDFPKTVMNYLGNQCINNGLTTSTVNFSIPLVTNGVLGSQTLLIPAPAPAPAPDLVVPEAPLSGLPLGSPAPAQAPTKAAAVHISVSLISAALLIVLHLLAAVKT